MTQDHTTPAVPMDGGREAHLTQADLDTLDWVASEIKGDGRDRAAAVVVKAARLALACHSTPLTPSSADAGAGLREAFRKEVAGIFNRHLNAIDADATVIDEVVDGPIMRLASALAAIPEGAGSVGEESQEDVLGYATRLAQSLVDKHFPNPNWRPLPDIYGVLTQIDNITTALSAPPAQAETAGRTRIAEMVEEYGGYRRDVLMASVGGSATIGEFLDLLAAHRNRAQAGAGDGKAASYIDGQISGLRQAAEIARYEATAWGQEVGSSARVAEANIMQALAELLPAAPIGTGNGEASV